MGRRDGLRAPRVPASTYDEDYFLHDCMGSDEWRRTEGREPAGLYEAMLRRASMRPGTRLLDIGTGRGELLVAALELGAEQAIGVDYSAAAIDLARRTLAAAGAAPAAEALRADARRLPVATSSFDLVTMLDVVEHLAAPELDRSLAEARRALRPGGVLFIHTMPNRLIYTVTYRLQRALLPSRRRTWPADPRNELERRMHVGEQSPGGLRSALRRAGFEEIRVRLGDWVYTDFVPQREPRSTYHRLARVPLLRRIAIADLYATARKPSP
jgi:ubiquinone/menaquinone biosynthesis C-methylase UbiE